MTDFAAIKAGDPGGILQIAFDAMKIETVSALNLLSSSQLNKWAAANGARKTIMLASEDYNHVAYELASAARSSLENTNASLDLSDHEVMGMLIGMEQAGLISTIAKDDLISRATEPKLKYPNIKASDIEYARGLV